MTLFQVEELMEYWADHPPVHLLVAGFLGIKPKEKPDEKLVEATDIPLEFMQMPGLAPMRPFTQMFGPQALDQVRDLWQQYREKTVTEH